MLAALVAASELRVAVPVGLVFASSVPFFAAAVAWSVVSLPLPRSVFVCVDDMMWSSYQRLLLFFFETVSNVNLHLYGDAKRCFERHENVLYFSNHVCAVDWVVADMLAVRQGSLGRLRYMLKDQLQYIPLYGWYFYQHGCVYVRRSGFRSDITGRQLGYLRTIASQFWLAVFPEGTRFDADKQSASQEYCAANSLPPLRHLLAPRARGLTLALRSLRPTLDAVYDVTVVYDDGRRQRMAPSMGGFVCPSTPYELHVHVERIPIASVPSGDDELRLWLHERYVVKDKLLDAVYTDGGALPDLVEADAALSIGSTLVPTACFAVCLTPLLWCSTARKAFVAAFSTGTILSLVWMRVRRAA